MDNKRVMSVIHSEVFNSGSSIHNAIMLLYELPKNEERDELIKKLTSISDDIHYVIQDPNLFTILGH